MVDSMRVSTPTSAPTCVSRQSNHEVNPRESQSLYSKDLNFTFPNRLSGEHWDAGRGNCRCASCAGESVGVLLPWGRLLRQAAFRLDGQSPSII